MRHLSRHLMNLSVALSVWGAALCVHAQATPPTAAPRAATPPAANAPAADAQIASHKDAAVPDLKVTSTRTESKPYVETTRTEKRIPNRPLLTTGSVLFIASYVPMVIASASMDTLSDNTYIPIAGPWMEIAREDNNTTAKTFLAIDGAVQGLSALMMVSSFFVPERRTANWYLLGNNYFQVTPSAGRRSYGLTARGSF